MNSPRKLRKGLCKIKAIIKKRTYKQSYMEISEDGTCEITESNLEKLRLVVCIYSSKAGFPMVSLTYPAFITTGQLYGNFNGQRTLLTQSIFPPVRRPVYLLLYLGYLNTQLQLPKL